MTDDVNARLDAIFNARSEREAEAVRIKREAEQKQEASLQEFLALKESLIRPTLESLAAKLNERGHKANIYEHADNEQVNGNSRPATIGIRFLVREEAVSRYSGSNEYPHLSMSVDKSGRHVQFYKSTMSPGRGGIAGGDGSVGYDALSEDMINNKVLGVIAEVYK